MNFADRNRASRLSASSVLVVGMACFGTTSVGWAAPPGNDNRVGAEQITPPQDVQGTLVDATLEPTNDYSNCTGSDGSVWYRFTASSRGAVIVQLDAGGDMDATVDLFRQVRSKLQSVDCAETNSNGVATIDNDSLDPGGTYAIRVGRQYGSAAAAFTLRVLVPSPPPEPPGRKLPTKGARGTVDRLVDSGDAFWTPLRAGSATRLNLKTRQCTALKVFGPGTQSFRSSPVRTLDCGGYALFTPTETGRHYLVVEAGKSRGTQPYRLKVAPAKADDTTPGKFIRNNALAKGKVNGGIDSRDLYRFDVTSRSILSLYVSGGPTLRLMRDTGQVIGRGSAIDRTVSVGRYYVAVQGSGTYSLHRVSRTITTAWVTFNGKRTAVISPGSSATLALRVRPSVAGPGDITVERFDPVEGWQFLRRYRVSVSGGSGAVSFRPPSVGRYRAYGEFKGSTVAAPDSTGVSKLRVEGPLVD